jgi:signal transduction histidine kinase/ActR/RegA family two-component response regulator
MAGAPLRRRLFVLVAAGILPVAVMAGLGLVALARQQRAQAQRVGLELARSVATAVDAELRSSVSLVEALATTPTLDQDDLDAYRVRAERVLRVQPAWSALVLSDPAGTSLVDTRFPTGAALPAVEDRASFDRLVRTGEPAVGGLVRVGGGEWLFPVRVPVVRGGALRYVLTALVQPQKIRGILNRQGVPGDWVISIVDANGRRVARSRAHQETLGGPLSPTTAALLAQGRDEGTGVAYTLEGEQIFSPYSRIAPHGWTAVLGIPTALVERSVRRSLAVYGGGVLLSILVGTLAALWIAASINRPMAQLREAAQAVGRREPPPSTATSIREVSEVAGALALAAEDLARSEAERNELLRKEREARQAAEGADRAKDEFMAVLSHELRTPLNAVYGWARMLQAGQLTDDALVARAMDAIVRNADIQVQLIDDLLDFARITSGKMRLESRAVDLAPVLQGAVDAVRPAAQAKSIHIEPALDGAGPVTGDPARLQQVVWNLLMNAVKFTPKGGRVVLRLRPSGSHAEIVVSDTGQGIAADLLPHVFERFRQADSSSTRAHGGLGLGLALVKQLVELHGGTVRAESAGPGQGATFTVLLPLVARAAAEARAAWPPPEGQGPVEESTALLRGLRVLVVDDEPEALALADAILTSAGAEVKTCQGAAEAFDALRHFRPHVLVSDIEMPGEDGYSLIRRIRGLAAPEGGATPAVALTAYGRTEDRTRSLTAGFSMHVPKPVDPGELTAIVADVARASPAGPQEAGLPPAP